MGSRCPGSIGATRRKPGVRRGSASIYILKSQAKSGLMTLTPDDLPSDLASALAAR